MVRMHANQQIYLIAFMAFILSQNAWAGYCSTELMDTDLGAHIVVSNCSNIGTFSVGGFYSGRWEKLTYFYPKPWEGTFISIYVDGKVYSNAVNPSSVRLDRSSLMDQYVEKTPYRLGDKITMRWSLPEKVIVEESFELIRNGTRIQFKITNRGDKIVDAGMRLHLDTMLGENDGAPIYIPGEGLKSNETSYSEPELDFEYWKAYNKEENATIIASNILYGEGLTYPNKIIVADWKKSMYSSWDYDISPKRTILGDSAVLTYYYPKPLLPNETRTVVTVYKNGEPILPSSKGSLGIADIVPEGLGDEYLPGKNISLSVDVVSRDIERDTSVLLEVVDKEGNVIYTYNTTTNFMEPDSVTPTEFGFQMPEDSVEGDFFDVKASILHEGRVVDQQSRRFSVSQSPRRGSFRLDDIRAIISADAVSLEVDVMSIGLRNSGVLRIQVIKDGSVVYEIARTTGILNSDTIKTMKFRWVPEDMDLDSIIIIATLYRDFEKVDEMKKEFSLRFRLKDIRSAFVGGKVTIEVDMTSSKIPNEGKVGIEILEDGRIIHDSMKSTGIVPPYMTTTVNFTWTPEDRPSKPLYLAVSLYKNFIKVDEITRELSLQASSEKQQLVKPSGSSKETDERPYEAEEESSPYLQAIGSALLALLLLLLNPMTREKTINAGLKVYDDLEERSHGKGLIPRTIRIIKAACLALGIPELLKGLRDVKDVEIEKMREGENIVLIIKNKSPKELKNCVVEDSLPRSTDISISDFHIIGKGNKLIVSGEDKLIWHIGTLLPGDTSILEYRMIDAGKPTRARLKWDKGEKTTG